MLGKMSFTCSEQEACGFVVVALLPPEPEDEQEGSGRIEVIDRGVDAADDVDARIVQEGEKRGGERHGDHDGVEHAEAELQEHLVGSEGVPARQNIGDKALEV